MLSACVNPCSQTQSAHHLTVEDNGVGICEEDATKVFELFSRGNQPSLHGFGVGLAFCKKIVALHGGAITIDYTFTKGCRLIIDLPLSAAEKRAANRQAGECDKAVSLNDVDKLELIR